MAYNYSAKTHENSAKSVGIALPISTKKSIEICTQIRGKQLASAKKILQAAITLKKAIPMRRFNDNTGHKSGMAAGRFAPEACKHILLILESAEANAQTKGLSTANLVVRHVSAQQGPKVWHYGRQKRREAKRTHIEVILDEIKTMEKETKKTKTSKPNIVQKDTTKVKEAKTEMKND